MCSWPYTTLIVHIPLPLGVHVVECSVMVYYTTRTVLH